MDRTLEDATMRKVYLRLVPYCFVLYFVCYLDRINISFAALSMNRDLGFSASLYGFGAGAFFWGYCLFEIPSNIVLEKVGARLWIARIMITWGILSVAMAFVRGPVAFCVIRALLGAAEAGFFPGIILYFTYWFPDRHRGRVTAWFMTAIPAAIALGAPVSTALLQLHQVWGLRGWQWLFIGEGVPAVLLGVSVLFLLTDRPERARWLAADERGWLVARLAAERRRIEAVRVFSVLAALGHPQVLILALIYGGIGMASVGLVLFLPQILKGLGISDTMAGLATAVPYVFGTLGMVVCGYVTDRTAERYWTLFVTCCLAVLGLATAALLHTSLWALAALSIATIGFYGMKAPFWPLPSTFLSGTAAAAGIALINSLGNLGAFLGPIAVGYAKDLTGSFRAGLFALAAAALVAAGTALAVAIWLPRPARRAAVNAARYS
jgi:MFS transporter, ACS family, tartrate transporter